MHKCIMKHQTTGNCRIECNKVRCTCKGAFTPEGTKDEDHLAFLPPALLVLKQKYHCIHALRSGHWTQLSKPDKHSGRFNLLKPTSHVMHQQFNIQQLYTLPTLYLCVLYLSENKTATCATYSIN